MHKINVVIYDTIGIANAWLDENADYDHMNISEVITNHPDCPTPIWDLPNYTGWDILLVFEHQTRDIVKQILTKVGIPDDRVLYALDVENSLFCQKELSAYLFNDSIRRQLYYMSFRSESSPYALVSTPDFSYISSSNDDMILRSMYVTHQNWSSDDMQKLFDLSNDYYSFSEEQILFCDIGANIGTTCIYFKKNIDPTVKLLALEPSVQNYKMLQINALLNDLPASDYSFYRLGVSDCTQSGELYFNPSNPGGSSLSTKKSTLSEHIPLIAFDDFLEKENICPKTIKYIWVDVEGHEARFLRGARKTLSEINVPVYIEFVPHFYFNRPGEFKMLLDELEYNFNYFICIEEPSFTPHPINILRDYEHAANLYMNLFLLKNLE